MRTVFKRLFLFSVFAGIFYLSHRPSIALIPPLFPFQDKVYHFVEFFIFGLALWINRDLFGNKYQWYIVVLLGVGWAGLDEIHQSFVPGRDCSFGDFLADVTGIAVSLFFLKIRSRHIWKNTT